MWFSVWFSVVLFVQQIVCLLSWCGLILAETLSVTGYGRRIKIRSSYQDGVHILLWACFICILTPWHHKEWKIHDDSMWRINLSQYITLSQLQVCCCKHHSIFARNNMFYILRMFLTVSVNLCESNIDVI